MTLTKNFFYYFHLDQKPSSLVNQSISSSFAFAVMIMSMQLISVIPVYFICTCLLKCTKECFGFCFRLQGLYGKSQQWMGIWKLLFLLRGFPSWPWCLTWGYSLSPSPLSFQLRTCRLVMMKPTVLSSINAISVSWFSLSLNLNEV